MITKDSKNAEIIKPLLRGRDIKRYKYEFADKWLILTHNGTEFTPSININEYPDIKKHLDQYYIQLSKRQDKGCTLYNLRSCAYMDDFSKQKIVWIELTDHPNFSLDAEGFYLNNTVFFITGEHLKYILAFLNSHICEWYFDKICATSGVGTRRWIKIYIDQICIPHPDLQSENRIVSYVDRMLDNKKLDIHANDIEYSINKEFANLFELTESEFHKITNTIL